MERVDTVAELRVLAETRLRASNHLSVSEITRGIAPHVSPMLLRHLLRTTSDLLDDFGAAIKIEDVEILIRPIVADVSKTLDRLSLLVYLGFEDIGERYLDCVRGVISLTEANRAEIDIRIAAIGSDPALSSEFEYLRRVRREILHYGTRHTTVAEGLRRADRERAEFQKRH